MLKVNANDEDVRNDHVQMAKLFGDCKGIGKFFNKFFKKNCNSLYS